MRDTVRYCHISKVVVSDVGGSSVRVQADVDARQIGVVSGLGHTVQEHDPPLIIKAVACLCVQQNGVLRGLGACVLQHLYAGIKTLCQCHFTGQVVKQLRRLHLGHRHLAACLFIACHSFKGTGACL